jgi:hypothetical protein
LSVSNGKTHAYTKGCNFLKPGIANFFKSQSKLEIFKMVSQICASLTDLSHVTMYHISQDFKLLAFVYFG